MPPALPAHNQYLQPLTFSWLIRWFGVCVKFVVESPGPVATTPVIVVPVVCDPWALHVRPARPTADRLRPRAQAVRPARSASGRLGPTGAGRTAGVTRSAVVWGCRVRVGLKGMDPGTLERDMDLGDVGRIRQVSAGQLLETS